MVREAGQGALTRLRHWVFDRPPAQWITGGFLVALLLSGLFGGLREVEPDDAPLVIGTAVDVEPLTITVDRVYWAPSLPRVPKPADAPRGTGEIYALKPDPKKSDRLLVVEGTLTNTSDETVYGVIATDSVRLEGLANFTDRHGEPAESIDVAPGYTYSLPEREPLSMAQPGITYKVAWIWEQPKGQPAPAALNVVVNKHTWRQDSLDFEWEWKDAERFASSALAAAKGP